MNKTQWLTAGVVTGLVVTLGYITLAGEDSTQKQQIEMVVQPMKSQVISISKEVKSETKRQEIKQQSTEISAVEDQLYERKAPPPPTGSNQSRDVSHNIPQAHGHEQTAASKQRRNNNPAPPTGANQ